MNLLLVMYNDRGHTLRLAEASHKSIIKWYKGNVRAFSVARCPVLMLGSRLPQNQNLISYGQDHYSSQRQPPSLLLLLGRLWCVQRSPRLGGTRR
jgi:hypothetical protein